MTSRTLPLWILSLATAASLSAPTTAQGSERERFFDRSPNDQPQPVGSLVLYDWIMSLDLDIVLETPTNVTFEGPDVFGDDGPVYLPSLTPPDRGRPTADSDEATRR